MTTAKIISRNVVQVDDEWYDLHLVMSSKPLLAGPGGGDPGTFPHQSCSGDLAITNESGGANVNYVQSFGWTATSGRLILAAFYNRGGGVPDAPTGYTELGSYDGSGGGDAIGVYGMTAAGGEDEIDWGSAGPGQPAPDKAYYFELTGVGITGSDSDNDNGGGGVIGSGTVTPTAGAPAAIFGFLNEVSDATITWLPTTAPGSYTMLVDSEGAGVSPRPYIMWQAVDSASGSYTPTLTYEDGNPFGHHWSGVSVALICEEDDGSPEPGQWVYDEVPTPPPGGGNRTFTTAHPYADGSLTVYVDRTNQTAAVTETSPAAGTFSLAFDPTSTELVQVSYQGR